MNNTDNGKQHFAEMAEQVLKQTKNLRLHALNEGHKRAIKMIGDLILSSPSLDQCMDAADQWETES